MTTERKSENRFGSIIVPVIVGIVGIIGTLSGIVLSHWLAERDANIQVVTNLELEIFRYRIEIIERASNIYTKVPGIQDVWAEYNEQASISRTGVLKAPPEYAMKLAEYKGGFESVIYLSMIYFGPKTKTAIEALNSEVAPWWNKKKENWHAFMRAIVDEQMLGVNKLPEIIKNTSQVH